MTPNFTPNPIIAVRLEPSADSWNISILRERKRKGASPELYADVQCFYRDLRQAAAHGWGRVAHMIPEGQVESLRLDFTREAKVLTDLASSHDERLEALLAEIESADPLAFDHRRRGAEKRAASQASSIGRPGLLIEEDAVEAAAINTTNTAKVGDPGWVIVENPLLGFRFVPDGECWALRALKERTLPDGSKRPYTTSSLRFYGNMRDAALQSRDNLWRQAAVTAAKLEGAVRLDSLMPAAADLSMSWVTEALNVWR